LYFSEKYLVAKELMYFLQRMVNISLLDG